MQVKVDSPVGRAMMQTDGTSRGPVKQFVSFLHKRARYVVGGVFILAIVAAPFATGLSRTTTDQFGAPPHTQSSAETEYVRTSFPRSFNDLETVYIQCVTGDCKCDGVRSCQGFKDRIDRLVQGLSAYRSDGTVVAVTSFFNYSGALQFLGSNYYNASASSMQVTLELDVTRGEAKTKQAITKVLDLIEGSDTDGFRAFLTGRTAAQLLSTKEAGKAIGMADGTGMLFIVLLFGWQVRSWRLTLIPVFNTLLCLMLAQGMVYPLSASGVITLPSYVPNVCLFLSIALSVDYSFFHLSRFQEVRMQGHDLVPAVEEMVMTAGRVVLVSGIVLLFTWLALAAFPVFGVDALGYCSAITIFSCIAVNLMMNPALVLAFPSFFSRAAQDPWHCCRRRRLASAEPGRPLAGDSVERRTRKNCYGSLADPLTRCPGMVVLPLVVYALLLPGAVRLFTTDLVVGGISGGTAETSYATSRILQDFPGSSGGVPLLALLSPPSGKTIESPEYFAAGCRLANLLQEKTGIAPGAFRGVMIRGQQGTGRGIACYTWEEVEQNLSRLEMYAWAWRKSASPDNTSSLLVAAPPFDAFSDRAKALVHQARDAVSTFNKGEFADWTVASYHPMAAEVDAEELTARRFPWVVLATITVVFTVIGVRYRAALIPLKLFFTIALPIVSVLGTGVFVFQDGLLEWTGIPSLKSQGGLVWINPVACTFMLIGFALDYDIFLFSRIYADRKSGLFTEDRPAILHAVAATGPVITTAGVIMALAFSGMVVQHSNPFLSQMGFTMIFGILVDTFVVRTLLVPAFLSVAGRFNWWPGVMPHSSPFPAATEVAQFA
mmetsp:Transcript_123010/g.359035  ORF Transcript_123010/g.359035 Transcript_123010/m.359035 type:complete len:831 (-) Transcript_123010:72-2564(-)